MFLVRPWQGLDIVTYGSKKKPSKNQVFLEAEALARSLGFLEDDGLRILWKRIGYH